MEPNAINAIIDDLLKRLKEAKTPEEIEAVNQKIINALMESLKDVHTDEEVSAILKEFTALNIDFSKMFTLNPVAIAASVLAGPEAPIYLAMAQLKEAQFTFSEAINKSQSNKDIIEKILNGKYLNDAKKQLTTAQITYDTTKSDFDNLSAYIKKVREGTALTGDEQKNAHQILGFDLTKDSLKDTNTKIEQLKHNLAIYQANVEKAIVSVELNRQAHLNLNSFKQDEYLEKLRKKYIDEFKNIKNGLEIPDTLTIEDLNQENGMSLYNKVRRQYNYAITTGRDNIENEIATLKKNKDYNPNYKDELQKLKQKKKDNESYIKEIETIYKDFNALINGNGEYKNYQERDSDARKLIATSEKKINTRLYQIENKAMEANQQDSKANKTQEATAQATEDTGKNLQLSKDVLSLSNDNLGATSKLPGAGNNGNSNKSTLSAEPQTATFSDTTVIEGDLGVDGGEVSTFSDAAPSATSITGYVPTKSLRYIGITH